MTRAARLSHFCRRHSYSFQPTTAGVWPVAGCVLLHINSPLAAVVVVTFDGTVTNRHVSLHPAASGLFTACQRQTGSELKPELDSVVWCSGSVGLQVLQWRETGGDVPLSVCGHLTCVLLTVSADKVSENTAFISLRKHLRRYLKVLNVI